MTPLESAAVAFVQARARVLDLKRRRNAFECEVEEHDESDPVTGYSAQPTPPCWKDRRSGPEGEMRLPDNACQPCRQREALHAELPEARRQHGLALRRLMRAGERAS